MADTDEASVAFARETEQSTQAVEKDAAALEPILRGLGYSNETGLLEEFKSRFAEYRALDTNILELAVENTNLKAQRMSFGPAQEAADEFRDSLAAIAPGNPAKDTWRLKALVETAIGGGPRDPGAPGAAHRGSRRSDDDPHGEADGNRGGVGTECARDPGDHDRARVPSDSSPPRPPLWIDSRI